MLGKDDPPRDGEEEEFSSDEESSSDSDSDSDFEPDADDMALIMQLEPELQNNPNLYDKHLQVGAGVGRGVAGPRRGG